MVLVADPTVLRGVPEFFENELGESIQARTESLATFRELGPPDLCHVLKTNIKTLGTRDLGSYHFVLGTDVSSSATVAAYLNSLTYTVDEAQGWFGGKGAPWKIKSGTYCCFNAFSRVDVRVEVKIPGGVESYLVDLRGDKHPIANPAIWQETAVSAVLRAILDDNDEADGNDGNPLMGLRKLDPIPSLALEKRFLDLAKAEFWKGKIRLSSHALQTLLVFTSITKLIGWQLGTEAEVQVATYFSNHLTNGIMKYFGQANRLGEAAKFLEPLYKKDPEVGAVLAKSLLGTDEEIKAVQTMHEALSKNPLSYGLLLVQIEFLKGKKKFEWALKLAKLAVTYAPSEFVTWSKLTEIYIELGQYESALLALNSCPMFTYVERDSQRMPSPARTHLPLKPDPTQLREGDDPKKIPPQNGTIFDENDPRENEVHPELQRLPALSLRGTFLKAYQLLIRIVSKVGWDELLRFRSAVFVMEEEYRIHRALMEEREKNAIAQVRQNAQEADRAREAASKSKANGSSPTNGKDGSIKSDGEVKSPERAASPDHFEEAETEPALERVSLDGKKDDSSSSSLREGSEKGKGKAKGLTIDELVRKTGGEEAIAASQDENAKAKAPLPKMQKHSVSFSFRNKRLCEKWLDNLFMVLYNDLRLYTALKQEISQYKTSMAATSSNVLLYRKTGAEWEIYGDLAERLEHREDAKEAYKLCLEQKFSVKAWLKLMDMYADEGNLQQTLTAAAKLVYMLDRAYIEQTYPSPISRNVLKLVRRHGLAKVQNALVAMNMPQKTYRLITRYFEYAEVFQVDGAKCFLQVLGTQTGDTCPSILAYFENQRYLFSVGEGSQRFTIENRVRLSKLSNIFLTRVHWDSLGGVPGKLWLVLTFDFARKPLKFDTSVEKIGMLLSLSDAGNRNIQIHGGTNLTHYIAATRHFVFRQVQLRSKHAFHPS
ncbi:hypothetical protein SmJEL517_g00625 [Synchytrium microbalum]|uniref:tRNase Z endonuclease domain-containing protein n=1 Tax=Synchytrium microbalum TaxID=1806994 RepID=A0A507CDN7_9FUNG|nr:uncharacterized protein SmJEL517_g00625 [Synchytrium microbalum]TPX37621.1 hypothetical protein SmJEL517_g00625 [Synchytrium microbalum]